jgi:hypothetical protein
MQIVNRPPQSTRRRALVGMSKRLTLSGVSAPQSVLGNQRLAERLSKRLELSGASIEPEELPEEPLLQPPREFLIEHRVREAIGYEPILVKSAHSPSVFVLSKGAARYLQRMLDRLFGFRLSEGGFGLSMRSESSLDVRSVYFRFRFAKLDDEGSILAGFAVSRLRGFLDPLTGKPGPVGIIYLSANTWSGLNLAQQLAIIGHELVHALQYSEAPVHADLVTRFRDELERFTSVQRYQLPPELRNSLEGRDPLDKSLPLELTAQLLLYAIMVESLGVEPPDWNGRIETD